MSEFKKGDRVWVKDVWTDFEGEATVSRVDSLGVHYEPDDENEDCSFVGRGSADEIRLLDEPATPTKSEHQIRKERPVFSGVLNYFPDALMAVAEVSRAGSMQHHPDKPLHWEFNKSTDHKDCLLRHLADSETLDTDGMLHDAKVAWRALANLQTILEKRNPELHAKRQAQRDKAAKGDDK